jgi:hypothetical protein
MGGWLLLRSPSLLHTRPHTGEARLQQAVRRGKRRRCGAAARHVPWRWQVVVDMSCDVFVNVEGRVESPRGTE